MEEERQYNGQKKKHKRTHIDLQNSFTCVILKYFVEIIRALSNIRPNAEYVKSISAIFANTNS